MLEFKSVSKSYEQNLTLVAGIGESVTPLRTRYAAAIESSGFRITPLKDIWDGQCYDWITSWWRL